MIYEIHGGFQNSNIFGGRDQLGGQIFLIVRILNIDWNQLGITSDQLSITSDQLGFPSDQLGIGRVHLGITSDQLSIICSGVT